MWLWRIIWRIMETAFVIGNGESRKIFPIEELKGHGTIWGCNAIYRDHPSLCDHIVSVNPPMYDELKEWRDKSNFDSNIYGPDDISEWNYLLDDDNPTKIPKGLKIYRQWIGSNNQGKVKILDLSMSRGSGMSALLLAAEDLERRFPNRQDMERKPVKNIAILGFDIMGSEQWKDPHVQARKQNNIYKNTINYPSRMNMKAYLKYEWMFQLRQIIRKFPGINFYFVNRIEYLNGNPYLKYYFDQPNVKCGIYADLKLWLDGNFDDIKWRDTHFKGWRALEQIQMRWTGNSKRTT